MSWHVSPLAVVLLGTSAFAVGIAVAAWRRRPLPGTTELALLMLAVAEWTLLRAFEAACVELSHKLLWAKLEYVGIVSLAPLWLLLAAAYTRQADAFRLRWSLPLWIVPAVTVALVVTNERHALVWTTIRLNGAGWPLAYTHGPWFWVNVAYSYVLLAAGSLVMLLGILRLAGSLRHRASVMLVAVAVPWCGNAVYIAGWSPLSGFDPTPFLLTVSGLLMAWSLHRLYLLDIVPIAHETLVEHLAYGVVVVNRSGRIVQANPAAARHLAMARSDVVRRAASDVFAPWPPLLGALGQPVTTTGEIEIAGDPPRRLEFRVDPLRDAPSATGSLVSLRDITAQKQAEETLRRSEERYRDLVENVEELICTHDMDGRLLSVNRALARKDGYARHELLGRSIQEFLAPAFREHFPAYLEAVRTTGRAAGFMTILTRDGAKRTLEFENTTGLDERGGRMVRGVARDVTDRLRAEQEIRTLNEELEQRVRDGTAELHRSEQKFQALTRLAPVGIYRTNAWGAVTHVTERWCEIAGLEAAAALGDGWMRAIDPGDRARVFGPWPRTGDQPPTFRLEHRILRPDGSVAWVMNQAMLEVDENGRMIGSVGTLTDITDLKQAEAEQQKLALLVERSPDLVAVADVDGRVRYVNDAGARLLGATDPVIRGSETVLVVEDEASVRAVVRRILGAAGYTVLEAKNGHAALDVLETAGRRVDLVLTDMVMPGMHGQQLAAHVHRRFPQLPVLFMSGYTADATVDEAVRTTRVTLLEKPFTASALSRAVRAALDAAAPSTPAR